MEGELSTLRIIVDGFKALRDAVELFIEEDGIRWAMDKLSLCIAEICLRFMTLLMIAVGSGTLAGFDTKRMVAIFAVLYSLSFIDMDFIPILGNVDDLILMHFAFVYCCNESTTKTARIVLQKNETWCKMIAVAWLLY